MGSTPIEGDNGHREHGQPMEQNRSGVRAWIRAAGRWLRNRLRSGSKSSGTGQVSEERECERHESTTAGTDAPPLSKRRVNTTSRQSLPEPSSDRPAARPAMPAEQSDVDTQREGDSFRVYDPDDPEAYITSDNWVPVER